MSYRLFPEQVDLGSRRSPTFDWLLSRTRDGSRQTAPRELIHPLSQARTKQLQRWEFGSAEAEHDELFDRPALKDALHEVSRVRLEQTPYAEYPALRGKVQQLEGAKTEQTSDTLAELCGITPEEAAAAADLLAEIGFFEKRGTREAPTYWVPFLYRDALNMIQGSAESERQVPASD